MGFLGALSIADVLKSVLLKLLAVVALLHARTITADYDDDRPFIVLTETKFSLSCIPVGIGTLLTGLGSKKEHM
jgi:hypothetical protein